MYKCRHLTFEKVCFADASLVCKVIKVLSPPPLREFITFYSDNGNTTRGINRSDCKTQRRYSEFEFKFEIKSGILSLKKFKECNKLNLD